MRPIEKIVVDNGGDNTPALDTHNLTGRAFPTLTREQWENESRHPGTIGERLAYLMEPHARKFDTDPEAYLPTWVECHEPLDCPGRINTRKDDWVFIMDSDTIMDGVVTLYPCHRECMTEAWGEDHVIPRPE